MTGSLPAHLWGPGLPAGPTDVPGGLRPSPRIKSSTNSPLGGNSTLEEQLERRQDETSTRSVSGASIRWFTTLAAWVHRLLATTIRT